MVIRDLSKPQTVEFCELKKGDAFRYNENIFLKIGYSCLDYNCSEYNAYNFEKNETDTLKAEIEVEYVPSELILHSPDWEKE